MKNKESSFKRCIEEASKQHQYDNNGIDGQQMLEMIGSLANTISKMQETIINIIENQNGQNEVIIELSRQVDELRLLVNMF